jgi:hypothetical protein
MDAEIKTKWVEALRSGNYKQTKAGLRKGDNFCCLGVLCDVVSPEGWTDKVNNLGYTDFVFEGRHNDCELPAPLREKLDLSGNQTMDLIQLNDTYSKPFTEIADYIEKNL